MIRPVRNTPPPAASVVVAALPNSTAFLRWAMPSRLQALLALQLVVASLLLRRARDPRIPPAARPAPPTAAKTPPAMRAPLVPAGGSTVDDRGFTNGGGLGFVGSGFVGSGFVGSGFVGS